MSASGVGSLLTEGPTTPTPAASVGEAMIFLGASLCITAFPMLARIIHFKGLTGTTMGTVAIGAGGRRGRVAPPPC